MCKKKSIGSDIPLNCLFYGSLMVSSSFALHQYYSVKHFRFTHNISGKLPYPYAIKSSDKALRHILFVAIQNEKSHRNG